MSVLVFEYINAISTADDNQSEKKRIPSRIGVLFANAGIGLPKAGQKIPVSELDIALKGLGIDERMTLKNELAIAGLI